MKKVQSRKKIKPADVPMRQKVFAAIALVGLFACGFMVGGFGNRSVSGAPKSIMSDQQCADLSQQIMWNLSADKTEFVKMAQEIFVKNCAGYVPAPAQVPDVVVTETVVAEPAEVTTCQRIEELLMRRLQPEDSMDPYAHLHNADTYSSLSERGCVENAEQYSQMALREIEIAMALQPVDEFGMDDTEMVIDVYKKLDMQAAAHEFLGKVQRLTDPAIDFILEMERIINE